MTHPLDPGHPDYEQMQDAGRAPTSDPDKYQWPCSRCGRDFAFPSLTGFVGDSGLVTRFCPVCVGETAGGGEVVSTDVQYAYTKHLSEWPDLSLRIEHALQLHGDRIDADPTNWELVADAREFIEFVTKALAIIDPKALA